jgi:hypothetical protein
MRMAPTMDPRGGKATPNPGGVGGLAPALARYDQGLPSYPLSLGILTIFEDLWGSRGWL